MNVTQTALNRMVAGTFNQDNLVMIITNAAAADADTAAYSEVSASEVSGTGYVQKDLSVTQTGSVLEITNVTWSGADFTDGDQVIVVESISGGAGTLAGTDPVVGYEAQTIEPNGSDITYVDHANGFLGLTLPA